MATKSTKMKKDTTLVTAAEVVGGALGRAANVADSVVKTAKAGARTASRGATSAMKGARSAVKSAKKVVKTVKKAASKRAVRRR